MKKDKISKWKQKFLELINLGKDEREIFEEMNKEEKTFNSLSEVRRIKIQITPKNE